MRRDFDSSACAKAAADKGVFAFLDDYRDRLCRIAAVLLIISVLALSIFGIVMLYSTSVAVYGEKLLIKQAKWICLGIFGAAVCCFMDYRVLCRHRRKILLLAALPLAYLALIHILALTGLSAQSLNRFPLVHGVNGAYRWLFIGSYSIQPSEFAKLAIIVFMAGYYGLNPRWAPLFGRGLLRPLSVIGAVLLLILLGGSLSLTVISAAVVLVLLFVAGVRQRYFIILAAALGLMIWGVLALSPGRLRRVTESWLHPENYRQTTGYQLHHSQVALGSASWAGVGFNRSRMKEHYLPEAHTDFIMAIVGEELGYLGLLLVTLMYLLLVGSAFLLGMLAVDRQGMLLGIGIGFSVGIHALANLAVVSGALPTTGVTAPLVSYGGSSMVVTWLGIGLLGSIARVARRRELNQAMAPVRAPNFELVQPELLNPRAQT